MAKISARENLPDLHNLTFKIILGFIAKSSKLLISKSSMKLSIKPLLVYMIFSPLNFELCDYDPQKLKNVNLNENLKFSISAEVVKPMHLFLSVITPKKTKHHFCAIIAGFMENYHVQK